MQFGQTSRWSGPSAIAVTLLSFSFFVFLQRLTVLSVFGSVVWCFQTAFGSGGLNGRDGVNEAKVEA